MIILGVSRGPHDASVTLLIDGNVVFYLEAERLSNMRHDRFAFQVINKIKDFVDHLDYLVLTSINKEPKYTNIDDIDPYSAYVLGLSKNFNDVGFKEYDFSEMQHEVHASTAFYNSGFKEALCIVKDGAGSEIKLYDELYFKNFNAREIGSVFIKKYPDKTKIINKKLNVNFDIKQDFTIDNNITITNSISEATIFEVISEFIGFTRFDAGKTMGLSAYGKKDSSIPEIYKNNLINSEIFNTVDTKNKINFNFSNIKSFEDKANLAYKIQTLFDFKGPISFFKPSKTEGYYIMFATY